MYVDHYSGCSEQVGQVITSPHILHWRRTTIIPHRNSHHKWRNVGFCSPPVGQFAAPSEEHTSCINSCLVIEFFEEFQNLGENLKKYQFLAQTQIFASTLVKLATNLPYFRPIFPPPSRVLRPPPPPASGVCGAGCYATAKVSWLEGGSIDMSSSCKESIVNKVIRAKDVVLIQGIPLIFSQQP